MALSIEAPLGIIERERAIMIKETGFCETAKAEFVEMHMSELSMERKLLDVWAGWDAWIDDTLRCMSCCFDVFTCYYCSCSSQHCFPRL